MLCCFPVAVIKQHDKMQVREERVYLCYGSRGLSVSWWGGMGAGAEAEVSYLELQVQSRKSRLETG